MKHEVISFFIEFSKLCSFKRSLNAYFIVLVLKKGRICKLLAKILATRFKKVVSKVISTS